MDPAAAAKKLIAAHPDMLAQWLNGVTTLDGSQDALPAVKAELGM
jgi:hypothetical protein